MSVAQAKKLRSNMTDAERRLWYRLRAHRFGGMKFKRQVPVGPFVVDFACLSHGVVIEVDGGQHSESYADIERDAWLSSNGFRVLRFWNHDVLRNADAVLDRIKSAIENAGLTPLSRRAARATLSPEGRGEGPASPTKLDH